MQKLPTIIVGSGSPLPCKAIIKSTATASMPPTTTPTRFSSGSPDKKNQKAKPGSSKEGIGEKGLRSIL
jgi:hypothetical protein